MKKRTQLRPKRKNVGGVKARRLSRALQAPVPGGLSLHHLTPAQCVENAAHYVAEARCMHQNHKEVVEGRWRLPCTACLAWATERVHDIISEPVKRKKVRK